jgi:serine 3-dehydrogenase
MTTNRIKGKLALITGATSGIGLSVARRFAQDGARLALWARREDRLRDVAGELERAHKVSVTTAAVDVRDRAAVNAAAEKVLKEAGSPDILLNNAGLAAGLSKTQDGDPDDWDRMIDTNVKGLLYVTRAFLPSMVARGTGHVVNIGSLAGLQVYPMGNVYNASKFAVRALSEAINLDVLGTRIRVACIDPGHVETEFAEVRFHGDTTRAKKVYEGFTPLTPDDIADVVSYVVNAPENVNILDVVLVSTAQRSVNHVHRSNT